MVQLYTGWFTKMLKNVERLGGRAKTLSNLGILKIKFTFYPGDSQISIFTECSIRTKEACQPLKWHIVQGSGGDQETWSLRLPTPK
jgi:hypothetical protein